MKDGSGPLLVLLPLPPVAAVLSPPEGVPCGVGRRQGRLLVKYMVSAVG
jgi:hypothetical protein